jgi:serine/threonine protein kinase
MITLEGKLKILDFGLARLNQPVEESRGSDDTRTVTRTRPGMIVGSPAYMSPEQAAGGTIDTRTDVFSAGVVLYEMAVGCSAFAPLRSIPADTTLRRHTNTSSHAKRVAFSESRVLAGKVVHWLEGRAKTTSERSNCSRLDQIPPKKWCMADCGFKNLALDIVISRSSELTSISNS